MINEINKIQLNNFLHNVAWLRQHHGFSKKKMAKLLGIGVESLNKMESGTLPPRLTVDTLFTIQDLFGISPCIMLAQRF